MIFIFIPMVSFSNESHDINYKIEQNYLDEYSYSDFFVENEFYVVDGLKGKNNKKNKDYGTKVMNSRRKYFSKRYSHKRRKPSRIYNQIPFAVKTNFIYGVALTPNLAIELPIDKKFSFEVSSTYNAWDLKDNIKWKNFSVMSEFRFWKEKQMEGRFIGINVNWAKYNIGGLKMPYYSDADYYRYDGWAAGVGVSAGYLWYITRSWSFEANIGLGLIYTSYDKYLQPVCGVYWGSFKNMFFMPTKLGLSIVYKFN